LLRTRAIPDDSVEAAVVPWIDGESDLACIANKTGLSVAEVTAAVRSLERLGIARFVDVVQLGDEELEELGEDGRQTLPNPAHDRPTVPGPQTLL
jgi:hypothetical protein